MVCEAHRNMVTARFPIKSVIDCFLKYKVSCNPIANVFAGEEPYLLKTVI